MPKINNKDAHEKVDKAILESVKETPAPARYIAKQTGEHITLVVRRYRFLGFEYSDGHWVWRGSKRTKGSSK